MEPGHRLPIDNLEARFLEDLGRQPLIVTAPTGSGKSTQVPRWAARRGRVLVVEPRRVACRALALRVAALEGAALGAGVGYVVRDEARASPGSRIVFATPGVVLRWLREGSLEAFSTVVLDEFHERSLEVDLVLALLRKRSPDRLVVMSATLEGERVARALGGVHLHAEGRTFPVRVRHVPGRAFLPDVRGLEERLLEALDRAAADPGDVLVFLPGKAEIAAAARALRGRTDLEVLLLHGGLSLEDQARVFAPSRRRRVVLSTNVAETSLTVPGIGVVIDSGLVRRTRYHNGRGFLTLMPVALDSAAQRAGRAGRTAPGVCYRLWSPEARLAETTPPEVLREALDPLVLAAAACGERVEDLPFLDLPRPYAVDAARENLRALGALDGRGRITARGQKLFGLPLDAPLGALLLEAERHGCLEDAVDLVAALAVGRPLFAAPPGTAREDLRDAGCDAVALIRAVRHGNPKRHGLHPHLLEEARAIRKRLREAWGLAGPGPKGGPSDRRRLALAALAADPRCGHVPRRRKKHVAWSAGGTEAVLGRESAVDPSEAEALVVLETRAVGTGPRRTSIVITCAMPVPRTWLLEAGLGEPRVAGAEIRGGVAVCRTEVWHAGQCLAVREEVPAGALARKAVIRLFLEDRLFPGLRETVLERLSAWALYRRLRAAGIAPALPAGATAPGATDPEEWLDARLREVGLESGEDLPLLTPQDLTPPALPEDTARWMDARFPRTVAVGDAVYEAAYDLSGRSVLLRKKSGHRKEPPSLTFLPPFRGFTVRVQHGNRVWRLR